MTSTDNTTTPENSIRHLSDLLVEYLGKLGVEYVFGVPGGHITPLSEALARSERRGGPRAVLSRHEHGGAAMADGYARETGKLGVCFTTTGPGVTNVITGIASAYSDHIPLLLITGQTPVPLFGIGAFQESSPDLLDTSRMLDDITCYSSVVTHPKQLERKLISALKSAFQSPRGPVHLSVPVDVFRAPAPDSISYPDIQQLIAQPCFVDLAATQSLVHLIRDVQKRDRKIVLLVGEDSIDAASEILAFATQVGANIVTTQAGKSCVDPYHPLYRGVFGFAGHQSARDALVDPEVELILAVGTTLGQWATSAWDNAILNEKLVHIHHVNRYFARSPMAQLHVYGAIKGVFETLLKALTADKQVLSTSPGSGSGKQSQGLVAPGPDKIDYRTKPEQIVVKNEEDYYCQSTPVHPQRLIYEIMQRFPQNTRFAVDTGNVMVWSFHYLFRQYPQYVYSSVELAAMGWGIGSAVGIAFAQRDAPVVCLTGDGSFLMNGQEMTVAVAERLPVIFIVLNDQSYNMVEQRHAQVVTEGLEFNIPVVDFSLMAKALGAESYILESPEDFDKIDYPALFSRRGPTLLDVRIDPKALSPLGMF